MTYNYKYHRYILTYPYIGSTIYCYKSVDKVAKKCYNNLKNIQNIKYTKEGVFIITDLSDNIEYKFKVKKIDLL